MTPRQAWGLLLVACLLAGGRLIRQHMLLHSDGAWRDPLWLDSLLPPLAVTEETTPPRPVLQGPVDINRCTVDTLLALPGIGPVLAERADGADWRQRHGIEGPMVLYLGQKFRYKNFHLLLEAAPAVWARHPQTTFVFIGPPTGFSRRVFARHKTEPRVVELGRVDLAEKTAALQACDVLCLPSPQESFNPVRASHR